jgi:hypothetical protein
VPSGQKATRTHEMPHRGKRGISCVRLAFSLKATYSFITILKSFNFPLKKLFFFKKLSTDLFLLVF